MWKNPQADKLMVTEACGFPVQFRTGDYQVGSLAVYIPIDSLVDVSRPEFSFLKSKDHPDRTHERIKARRLRGTYSEGLIIPAPVGAKVGDDLSGVLGVTKYEDPEDQEIDVTPKSPWRRFTSALNKKIYGKLYGKKSVAAAPFPEYDIESIRKHKDLLQLGEEVVITEKIHGCVFYDTIVDTLEMGKVSINTVTEGMHVLSYNEDSEKTEYKEVLGVSVKPEVTEWFEINAGGKTIKTTGNHKFYLPSLGCYRRADELTEKDEVLLY
jgi:hypothetical protein